MKKFAVGCIILCVLALICASIIPTAKASISSFNWIGAFLKNGYDEFYGRTITAYEEESTASLVVNVYNDHGAQGNVSVVKVSFDWGQNYTSNECNISNPFIISLYDSHVFTITFELPSASLASNLVTHSYTIYVELVNSTTGDKGIVKTWTERGDGFAVFSSDQTGAYKSKIELEAYPYSYIPFLTAKARELMTESTVAKSIGRQYYTNGDFANAKIHYQNALLLTQQSWANETEKWSKFEDTFAGILKGAENLLMMQGYSWLLFGLGFLLIGIGALVYLVRRPTTPKTS